MCNTHTASSELLDTLATLAVNIVDLLPALVSPTVDDLGQLVLPPYTCVLGPVTASWRTWNFTKDMLVLADLHTVCYSTDIRVVQIQTLMAFRCDNAKKRKLLLKSRL